MEKVSHINQPARLGAAAPDPAQLAAARIGRGEHEAALAIGVSVHWLRKDRLTKRLIPFYRLGDRVVYDLGRVREALAKLEVGGTSDHTSGRRSRAAHGKLAA